MKYVPVRNGKPYYADCDICGHFHPEESDGDCTEPRYTVEELDTLYGKDGWEIQAFAELILVDDDGKPIVSCPFNEGKLPEPNTTIIFITGVTNLESL